jgi:hypothetical protein
VARPRVREGRRKHRIVEIRTKSILKLDRTKQQTEAVPQEAEPSDVPF